jgi:thioredoxin reductase
METLIASLIGVAVTFFFVRRYVRQLTAGPKPASKAASGTTAAPVSLHPCPRCAKAIPKGSAFCAHCGAALAMWNVHRATVQAAGASPQGKPRPVINASLCVGCGSCVHACPEQGTLEMLGGKAILAHAERCTGHAKCVEVCPTQALSLSVGGVLQTLRVPLVKENFETNIPGIFIVGELGGMGLIKTAINEGKLVVDHLRQRDCQAKHGAPPVPSTEAYDVAIVGSGPAGLSASLAAVQAGLRYVTLEQGEIASTIRQYPRQKFLMAEPVEIPLYGSLYVADGTKEALLSVWETILANTGVQVRTNEGVERIRKNGAGFYVESAKGQYLARHVVLAMGRRGKPRRLNVPGEELSKVAYRLIEAETYHDQDVLVVGGGDSAIEAALALSRSGTNRVTLSYRGDNFQRARARNQQMLATGEKEGKLTILRNSNVSEVTTESVTLDCSGKRRELRNHYTFVLIGGESPEEFLRRTGIEIVEKILTA